MVHHFQYRDIGKIVIPTLAGILVVAIVTDVCPQLYAELVYVITGTVLIVAIRMACPSHAQAEGCKNDTGLEMSVWAI